MLRKFFHFSPYDPLHAIVLSSLLLILLFLISGCSGGEGDDNANLITYYEDSDNDGYGDPNSLIGNEQDPNGFILTWGHTAVRRKRVNLTLESNRILIMPEANRLLTSVAGDGSQTRPVKC